MCTAELVAAGLAAAGWAESGVMQQRGARTVTANIIIYDAIIPDHHKFLLPKSL